MSIVNCQFSIVNCQKAYLSTGGGEQHLPGIQRHYCADEGVAYFMFPQYLTGFGLQGKYQSLFSTAEHDAVFFNLHGRSMFVTETDIACPQFAGLVAFGCVADNAVVHRLTVHLFAIFRQADSFTYYRLERAPYGFAVFQVDGCHCTLRVGDKYFAVCSYGPYGGRGEVHAGQSACPLP